MATGDLISACCAPSTYAPGVVGSAAKKYASQIILLARREGFVGQPDRFLEAVAGIEDRHGLRLRRPELAESFRQMVRTGAAYRHFEFQMLLGLWAAGAPVEGSTRLDAPGAIFVGDRLIELPGGSTCEFSGHRCRIWQPASGDRARGKERLLARPRGMFERFVDRSASFEGTPLAHFGYEQVKPSAAADETVRDAIEMLRPHPHLWHWVVDSIQLVYLVEAPGEYGAVSTGASEFPGAIIAGTRSNVVLGEILVHEASHQYFFLLMLLATLEQPGAPMAWSVIKQTDRTPTILLLSYHAYITIRSFYQEVEEAGTNLTNGGINHAEQILMGLEKSLDSIETWLTPEGNDIYRLMKEVRYR